MTLGPGVMQVEVACGIAAALKHSSNIGPIHKYLLLEVGEEAVELWKIGR